MMITLDQWLKRATRCLARDAAAQVRTEISEHYESALEAALARGVTGENANQEALSALGDPETANGQYRRVLLTVEEGALLREGSREVNALCRRAWPKRLLLVLSFALVTAAVVLFLTSHDSLAGDVLICGLGISPLFAALLLPINTPRRGLVFRCAKWLVLTGALLLLFGPNAFRWSWLLLSSVAPLAWTEWKRASIRRKLPIEAWPRHLYL